MIALATLDDIQEVFSHLKKEIIDEVIKGVVEELDKREMNRNSGRLYNVTEAAKKLGVTPSTLHSYIRNKLIWPLKINGSNKFTDEILDDFTNNNIKKKIT